jgi:hypothetical protein
MRKSRSLRPTSGGAERRSRFVRVRVETEDGCYLGRVRIESASAALRDVVDDERAYLGLWDTVHTPSGRVDEFVAIHKASIRYVVETGREEPPRLPTEEA